MAQRPLPLRPLPETWGRFDFAPTPPNDSKGRGCGPSPLDSPPGDRQRQREEKQVKSVLYPGFAIPGRGLTTERFSKAGPAPNASTEILQGSLLLGPPYSSKKGAYGAGFAPKRFSFGPGAARFLCRKQRKWGAPIPVFPLPGGTKEARPHGK